MPNNGMNEAGDKMASNRGNASPKGVSKKAGPLHKVKAGSTCFTIHSSANASPSSRVPIRWRWKRQLGGDHLQTLKGADYARGCGEVVLHSAQGRQVGEHPHLFERLHAQNGVSTYLDRSGLNLPYKLTGEPSMKKSCHGVTGQSNHSHRTKKIL